MTLSERLWERLCQLKDDGPVVKDQFLRAVDECVAADYKHRIEMMRTLMRPGVFVIADESEAVSKRSIHL